MKTTPCPITASGTSEDSTRPRRLTLPVAPRANARIRFATITGPPMAVMSPEEAVAAVTRAISEGYAIEAVDIIGPGDPLATPESTIECLSRLHRSYPELDLGMTTNGLGGAQIAGILASSGLRQVTLVIDAITTVTAETIYAWIRPGTKTVPLTQAVVTLLSEQAAAVAAFAKTRITVNIATTVYPGFNDGDVEKIALKMAALGASTMSVIPYRPTPDDIGCLATPSAELMAHISARAGRHLPPGIHSPAVQDLAGTPADGTVPTTLSALPRPSLARPNVAVTSHSGMEIDQHLGQAVRLLIYGPREDGLVCLLETRPTPAAGGDIDRWQALAGVVPDCFALLTANAGENPRATLSRLGLMVMITDGDIEGSVDALYGGGKKPKKRPRLAAAL